MRLTPTLRVASVFLLGIVLALGAIEGNQRQVHADAISDLEGLGERIICKVFTDLNAVGSPLPHLDVDGDCSTSPPPPPTPQCSDGIDNDGDGLIDNADPGCSGTSDNDEANAVVVPQCSDGTDNDSDGFVDSNDPNCHSDANPTNTSSYNPNGIESGSLPACWNGIDDDGDGLKDWAAEGGDPGCTSAIDTDETDVTPPAGSENTLALCSDGADNDGDSKIDISDTDCSAFKPKLVVVKIVINDNGGTSGISNFSLSVATTGPGMAESIGVSSGSTTTLSFAGAWKVGETANSNYTASFGGDCNAGGEVVVGIGQVKTCTITNNDVAPQAPACSDGVDNDADGLIDSADPGCANASDTDELNSNSPGDSDNQNGGGSTGDNGSGNGSNNGGGSSGSGGGGNGPSVGSFGIMDGTAGGVVLGASTSTLATTTESMPPESCDTFITAYIRSGRANDAEQVRRLQMILRDTEGASVDINGTYDAATESAVHSFQTKYAADILTPWGIEKSTGYVYITTRRKLNEIYCRKTKEFPLSSQDLAEIVRVRELAEAVSTGSGSRSEENRQQEVNSVAPVSSPIKSRNVVPPSSTSTQQDGTSKGFDVLALPGRFIDYFKKVLPNR